MGVKTFSFAGKAFIGKKRTDGHPAALAYMGNVPSGAIILETQTSDIPSNISCNRGILKTVETGRTARLEMNLSELLDINMQIGLRATKQARTGTSVTNETLTPSTGVAVGDFFITKFQDISSVTVTDSAGSPATLTANTHYRISSAKQGRIEILSLGSFTLPFKINYTYAAATVFPLFTESLAQRFLHVELENVADDCLPGLLQLFSVAMQPTSRFDFLNTEIGSLQLAGSANEEPLFESDAQLGKFGRYIPYAAA